MLKTCLKYDFRAIRGWVGWMVAAILGCSAVSGLSLQLTIHLSATEADSVPAIVLMIFAIILFAVGYFGLMAAFCVGYYLPFVRFYRNFFTDQGYLTFTLPVKRSTLYLSKVITGTVAQLAVSVAFVLGILTMAVLGAEAETDWSTVLGTIGDVIRLYDGRPLLWILPALLCVLAFVLLSNGMAYLALVIAGTRIRRMQVFAAIGICSGFNYAVQIVGFILAICFGFAAFTLWEAAVAAGSAVMFWVVAALILIAAMIIGCIALIFHNIAAGTLERRLNLA